MSWFFDGLMANPLATALRPEPISLTPAEQEAVAGDIKFLAVVAVAYVITAALSFALYKKIGFAKPVAAWVPVWNSAAMLQAGGIRMAWMFAIVSVALGMVPLDGALGILFSLLVLAFLIMLVAWAARGVQAGLGLRSTGGLWLAVLVPTAWQIWMLVRASRPGMQFDVQAAMASGAQFPLTRKIVEREERAPDHVFL